MQTRDHARGVGAWAPGPAPMVRVRDVLRDVEARVPWPLIAWRDPPRIVETMIAAPTPTYVATGTRQGGVGAVSPAWPAGHAVDDVAIGARIQGSTQALRQVRA